MMSFKWLFLSSRRDYLRKTIGVISIALATSLLTWTVGIAVTSLAQVKPIVEDNSGGYSCWITPKVEDIGPRTGRGAGFQRAPGDMPKPPVISPVIVDAVTKSKLLDEIEILNTVSVQIDYRPGGKLFSGPRPRANLSNKIPDNGHFFHDKLEGRWPDESSVQPEVVFSTAAFFRSPPTPNEPVAILTRDSRIDVKIVGFIKQERAVQGYPTMFANKALLDRVFSKGSGVTLILCKPKTGVSKEHIIAELADQGLGDQQITVNDIDSTIDSMQEMNWMQFAQTLPMKVGLSLAFMFCMIFTTFYAGVQQRSRIYSMLRAIGMSRFQLTASLAFEAMIIGTVGSIIGIAIGYCAVFAFVATSIRAFPYGLEFSLLWLLAIFGAAVLSTLIAAAWPCIKVFRLRPLDHLDKGKQLFAPLPWKLISVGILLMLPAVALTLPINITPDTRCTLLGYIGIPLLGIGVLLSSSLWVAIVDKLFVGITARLLMLDPRLLQHQIVRDLSRTVGVMATISVGLGLYIAVEIWGASMLNPFKPDRSLPDIVMTCLPQGLDNDTLNKIAHEEGVDSSTFMPLLVDQFVLSDEVISKLEGNIQYDLWQNNIILLGVDPQVSFGDVPLLPFDFTSGNMNSAKSELKNGGTCIITRTFATQSGLQIGDTLGIRVPDTTITPRQGKRSDTTQRPEGEPQQLKVSEHTEQLRIVGVVNLNWHLYTSRAEMRGRQGKPHRTLGPVFVSAEQAQRMIPKEDKYYFAWFNLTSEYKKMDRVEATNSLSTRINKYVNIPGMEVKVRHRDQITADTIDHARDIIGALSSVPFWSLLIFSLSMLNLLIAIVVERRKELGTMRAIGMTKWQFARQLAGEVILVWGAGVLFSVIFGVAAGWSFTGWSRVVLPFGGIPLVFDAPWGHIALSIAFSLLTCCFLAVLPIAWMIRGKPCEMLQSE